MKENPLISVVTVCFNAVKTIEETILSVLNQTYSNVEYIIIDGGSTDGTIDIINKYADKLAYWVSEPDKGIYDAMNKGIIVAKGDFIYFIGADDILLPNVFNQIFKGKSYFYDENIYGNVILSNNGRIIAGKFNKWKLIRYNICHQAIFYSATNLKKIKFDLKYKALADWFLNITLWGNGYKFRYIPVTIASYNTGGFSSKGDLVFRNHQFRIVYSTFGYIACLYYELYRYYLMIKKMIIRNNTRMV